MEIKVQKVLEYEDVFPGEPFNIEDTLKKYNRELIVRCVCVLGHSYRNAYWRSSRFFSSISNNHIRQLNERVILALKKLGVEDICYSTIKTSLELLRITFSISPNAFNNTGLDEDFEYDMFRVILKVNSKVFFHKHDDSLLPDELIYFNQFATNDTNFAQLHSIFRTQCYYTSEMFGFLEQYYPDVLSSLLKYWNITDYRKYILTIYSIFFICHTQQQKSPRGYWLLDFDEIKIQKGFFCPQVARNLSIDINEIIPYSNEDTIQGADNIDYKTFRSRPLIRLSENKYYIYNLQLLIERSYNSLFFDLKQIWNGTGFSDFFNKKFVEYCLFRHTMSLCSNKKDYTFPTNQMIAEHETNEVPNQPDFYIRRQGTIVLFECKAFKVNGRLKDSVDLQDFLRELKIKIYEATANIDRSRKTKKKPEPVGVTQLLIEIEKIEDNDFPFDTKIPDNVEYYPVIVLEDSRFILPGLMSIVNKWSKKLFAEKLGRTAYYPIIITSIDILFQYSDTFRKKGFPQVINTFFQDNNARLSENGIDWEINPVADFNSFIKSKYKRNSGEKLWLDRYIKRIATNR